MFSAKRKEIKLIFSLFSIIFLLIGMNIPVSRAQYLVLGISEGDSLVYKMNYTVSMNGRTVRDQEYHKYVITSIPNVAPPFNISGNIYQSDSTDFGAASESNVRVATIDTYPLVGSIIIPQNSVFEASPSQMTEELYNRLFNADVDVDIESVSINSFTVLAKGLGYKVNVTIISGKEITQDTSFPYHEFEVYIEINLILTAYYSSTGICLREDLDANAIIHSQRIIDSIPFGSEDTIAFSVKIDQRIQPSLSSPEGLNECPWISIGEWILIGVSGPVVILISVWLVKRHKKKKSQQAQAILSSTSLTLSPVSQSHDQTPPPPTPLPSVSVEETRVCLQCNTINSVFAKFCSNCGKQF